MTEYPDIDDMDALWPESGYAVVEMDTFKPPDDEDFIVNLGEFDSAEDVIIPAEKEGYSYYIHGADGESYSRSQWHTFVGTE